MKAFFRANAATLILAASILLSVLIYEAGIYHRMWLKKNEPKKAQYSDSGRTLERRPLTARSLRR